MCVGLPFSGGPLAERLSGGLALVGLPLGRLVLALTRFPLRALAGLP